MGRVSITRLSLADHDVVRIVGALGRGTAAEIQLALSKALFDAGRVLVDLSHTRIEQASRVNCLAAALDQAGGWPRARLVLFGGTPSLVRTLASSGVTRSVPHAPTPAAAATLLDVRPALVRRTGTLDPEPGAPLRARALVTEAGEVWGLPAPAVSDALLVVTELVANSVCHAGTPVRVVVEFDGTRVALSVGDHAATRLPDLQPMETTCEGGLGLHLVEALAEHWGVTPGRHGKTVWAVMAPLNSTPPTARTE